MMHKSSVECGKAVLSTEFQPEDLLTPTAFPHSVTRLQIQETEHSWVITTGTFAYKIKKAVVQDSINATAVVQRRDLCVEELRLNRRLAPSLYLEVVAITQEDSGLRIGGRGPIIEYALKMKQFDESQRLSTLLDAGQVTRSEIIELARRMAHFHSSAAKAARSPAFKRTQQLRNAVLGNLAILIFHLDTEHAVPAIGRLIDWTHDYLHDSMANLRLREESGFVRECHGDLYAGNVVRWQDQLTPINCVDIDPALRWIDVMSDISFLVMDLAAHDRKDLAFSFLNKYLDISGDYEGVRLLAFYAIYRALVRALADSLEADRRTEHRDEFHRRMLMRVRTATDFMDRLGPALILMPGPSGSGKSQLSERLIERLEAVCIRSEVERNRLAKANLFDPCDSDLEHGTHDSDSTQRTYARLIECAKNCLEGGITTIVDAAFLRTDERKLFYDLAQKQGIPYFILWCEADHAALVQPIDDRTQERSDFLENRTTVPAQQLQNVEPLSIEEQEHLITTDTSRSAAEVRTRFAIRKRIQESYLAALSQTKC